MKKALFIMAAALLMMTQCRKENATPNMPADGTVKMTVTAGPGRTDINTATGAITWSEGDRLYVSKNGSWLGSLTLVSGAGTANGTFTGDVTGIGDGTTPCHFFYLGHDNGMTEPTGSNDASISMAAQDGTLAGAMKYHLGYGNTDVTVTEGEATGSVIMNTKIAIAHINFTDGTSAYTGSLTMGGTGIGNTMTVSPDGSFTGGGDGGIVIGGATGERYVTLIPTTETDVVRAEFTGDAIGSLTFANGIEPNKFYGMSNAMVVTVEAAAPAHETVNFGTPNLNWSKYNLGVDPEHLDAAADWYGWYFMWGSVTEGGDPNCSWANCPGNGGSSDYNATAFSTWKAANLTGDVLNSDVDAATAAWGGDWRMPTSAEWQALYDNNTFEWLTVGATSTKVTSFTAVATGYLVIKGKDSSLDPTVYMFLPAAGYRDGTGLLNAGSNGNFWSSSLNSSNPNGAYYMYFDPGDVDPQLKRKRYFGYSVRPVRAVR